MHTGNEAKGGCGGTGGSWGGVLNQNPKFVSRRGGTGQF